MKRSRTWLVDNGATAATIVGLLSGIPFGTGYWPLGVVLVLIAAALMTTQLLLRRQDHLSARARVASLLRPVRDGVSVESTLQDVAREAGLLPPWRLSLYEVVDGSWQRLARASNYPVFATSGRPSFELGQGVVTWALRSGGTDALPELPDRAADVAGYTRMQLGRSLDEATAMALTMPSRSYAALARQAVGTNPSGHHIGLVAESEQPRGVDLTRLERAVPTPLLLALHKMAVSRAKLDRVELQLDGALRNEQ